METPNLDLILKSQEGALVQAHHAEHDAHAALLTEALALGHRKAVAELSQLKQRVADLELMLRAALTPCGGMMPHKLRRSARGGFKYAWNNGDGSYSEARLADDGTGLPVLTEEAREALRKC